MSDYIDAHLKALHWIPDVPYKTNDLEAALDPKQTQNDSIDAENPQPEIAAKYTCTPPQDLDLDNLTDKQIAAIFEDDDNNKHNKITPPMKIPSSQNRNRRLVHS